MSIDYTPGQTYNTLRSLGCRWNDKKNSYQLSEKTGQDVDDVEPSENLKFIERTSSGLIFEREDGVAIIGHDNHFNPDAPYNNREKTTRSAPKSVDSLEKQIAYRSQMVDNARKRFEEQTLKLAELVTAQEQLAVKALEAAAALPEDPTEGDGERDESIDISDEIVDADEATPDVRAQAEELMAGNA